MTSPVYFTVEADFKAFIEDASSDSDYDPQVVPISATVTFTPLINAGDVVLATNASPRPTGFIPAPITAIIDPADGRLKMRTGTDAGATGFSFAPVRLLGSSALLELDGPLEYSARFSEVVFSNGRRGTIASFNFEAPNSDTVLNLIEVARVPGQVQSGITKIAPGGVRLEDGDIIFSFASLDIPESIPFTPLFTSTEMTDSTTVGRAVITSVDAAAARTAIGAENAAMKGASGGYAPLDSSAKIDAAYLPSYVDDVLAYTNQAAFPATGETGKIYVANDTGDAYRWTGSAYLRISDRVTAAGITDSTSTGRAVVTATDAAAARTAIGAESSAMKGASGGYAPLDSSGLIDAAYLPSYVDDVLSYANQAAFPVTGETGKIYVAQDNNDAFRWTGSAYLRISDRVTAAGITDSTSTGRALVTATDAAAARTAVGATSTGSSLITATNSLAARTAISAARAGGTIFVEDYRDGVRTDSEMITAAFDAVGAGGEVRFGPGVTYTTGTSLVVVVSGTKTDVLINGQGAIINGNLSFRGNRYAGTITTLTSAITSRTNTLTVASTSGWAAGDMLRLFSDNEIWSPGYTTAGTSRKSEMARVEAIPNSTTFTLDARTWDTYSITGNTVSCQQYAPMKNLTIRDLTLVGNYADDDLVGLDIRYFDGLRLQGILAKGFGNVGIGLTEGINVLAIGCRAEDTMGSSNGYGFSHTSVNNARWIGCYGLRNRHSFDAFLTRDLEVIACAAYHNRSAGFSTHSSTDTVKFVNNTARECGGGFITRGRNTMIRGNHIYGTRFSAESSGQTYRSGITIGNGEAATDGYSGENLVIDGNLIDLSGPTYGTYPIEGDVTGLTNGISINETLVRARITNNTMRNFPTIGIHNIAGGNTSAEISGNHIDCSQHVGTYKSAILIEPYESDAAHVQASLVIRNNTITGTNASTYYGIRVSGGTTTSPRSDDLVISNNKISACQTAPIFLGGTYFYATDLVAPFTDRLMPRTGGYFGSAVYVYDNTTADAVSVSYTGANHTATPYIRNNRHANKAVLAGTTSDTADSGAQFLGALGTGIVKNTTTTGALSIAVAADFPTLNQSTTGSAATLTTARTVRTDLTSTSTASFDGSANITPGVTGTLAVSNGGSGVTSLTGLVKGTGTTAFTAATAGTDYVSPAGIETVSNKTFISRSASTATAAGTTTLTVSDAPVQIFTGTTTQTVQLPSTGVVAGQEFKIINSSTGTVTVQSSGANTIVVIASTRHATFRAVVDEPTTAANWKAEAPSTAAASNSSIVERDSRGWIFATAFSSTATSTASSAGTLTMANTSTQVQVITGSTTHTVRLPSTSVSAGMQYTIVNQSSGDVTVQSSGANTIGTLTGAGSPTAKIYVALQSTPTAQTHWREI